MLRRKGVQGKVGSDSRKAPGCGQVRAGTGSAMYYLWHAETLSAIARIAGDSPIEKLPCNALARAKDGSIVA